MRITSHSGLPLLSLEQVNFLICRKVFTNLCLKTRSRLGKSESVRKRSQHNLLTKAVRASS
jgi:hypothetical protein